jgi:hypothetical protein
MTVRVFDPARRSASLCGWGDFVRFGSSPALFGDGASVVKLSGLIVILACIAKTACA